MGGGTDIFIAIAVILLAVVSLIMTGARRRAVEQGFAQATDLCELTGITDIRALQDIFGPPTMNGVYQVSVERVEKERRPEGLLLSSDVLDICAILIAGGAIFISHPLSDLMLLLAAAYKAAGIVMATKLPPGV